MGVIKNLHKDRACLLCSAAREQRDLPLARVEESFLRGLWRSLHRKNTSTQVLELSTSLAVSPSGMESMLWHAVFMGKRCKSPQ